MTTEALESDVKDLRSRIDAAGKDEAGKRKAADELRDKYRTDGFDMVDNFDQDSFDRVDEAYVAADSLRDEIAELKGRLNTVLTQRGQEIHSAGNDGPDPKADREFWSIAKRFSASDEYQNLRKTSGLSSALTRVSMNPVEVASRDATVAMLSGRVHTAATVDGSMLVPIDQRLFPPVETPSRTPRLHQLVTVGRTDSNLVRYARQTARTDVAAETAYGVDSPEATYTWETVDAAVKRITQFIPAPKDSLMDQAGLETLVGGQLQNGVVLRAEGQMLSGDGTGENLTGINNTAGIGSQAVGSDSVPDALHKAITVVRIALEDDITAFGLHPTDYEGLALTKSADGQYLNGSGWQN
ncbi:MAG: phage major capsid protein, partial [Actinomycetia bacterium]|nr:phage major capsid protein [Actinomycetes bacterium]